MTWYALFAKDYAKALAVADHAHALFPDNLGIEINRAHVLMFMGHDEEAKALYLAIKERSANCRVSYGSKSSLKTLRNSASWA